MNNLIWRKSSYSTNTNCVEVADLPDGGKAIRDTKRPEGRVLRFSYDEWSAFIDGVKNEEFD